MLKFKHKSKNILCKTFRNTIGKVLVIAVGACMGVPTLFAQNQSSETLYPAAPDYEKIFVEINTDTSPYFYPKLFSRYREGDTTLNLEDYRHLYYGYSFSPDYQPLKIRAYSDSLAMVLSQNKDSLMLSPELFEQVERFCSLSLESEPFSMNFINFLTYIYQMSGKTDLAKRYSYQMRMIKQAILSSGTGVSDKSPWHVLYRSDMLDLLASLKARPSKRMYVTAQIEYFHLPVKNGDARGYYFNTGRIFTAPSQEGVKIEAAPPKRRFEFNPYQNPRSSRYIKDIKY